MKKYFLVLTMLCCLQVLSGARPTRCQAQTPCDSLQATIRDASHETQWFLPLSAGQGPIYASRAESPAYTASLYLDPTLGLGTDCQFRIGPRFVMIYTNPAVELFAGGKASYQLFNLAGIFKFHVMGFAGAGSRNHTLVGGGIIGSIGELVQFSLAGGREANTWAFSTVEAGIGVNLFSLFGVETRPAPRTAQIDVIDKTNFYSHVEVSAQQEGLTCLSSAEAKRNLGKFLRSDKAQKTSTLDRLASALTEAELPCIANKITDIMSEAYRSTLHEGGNSRDLASQLADEGGVSAAFVAGLCRALALSEQNQ